MSIQSDESFFQRIDDLRDSVEKILPKTQAADRIEELCRKVKTTYRDVRISGKKSRSPVVAIVADSSRDRRWVVGLLRRRLAQQLNLDRELSDDKVEGFGSIRPDWFPRQSRFEAIENDSWNGVSAWSCVGIDPTKIERVDADLVFYVTRFEDLQTDAAVRAVCPFAGIPIVPVVLKTTQEGKPDLLSFEDRLREALNKGPTLPLLAFPDFDDKRTEVSGNEAEQEIWDQCQSHVDVSESSRRQIQDERCEKIRQRFDEEARSILGQSDFSQVNDAIEELKHKEKAVLREQTMKWISGSDDLRIPIRIRLRLLACEITPSLCFPFRSILGVLAVTSGVWDRLAMAMLGSPVALALAAYQSGGQLWRNRNSLNELTEDAADRFSRSVVGELEDTFSETRRAITNRLPGSEALTDVDRDEISVRGSDVLLRDVRRILDRSCRDEISNTAVRVVAILCTLVFIVMFSGPVIALYGDYVRPLLQVWSGQSEGVESFPLPELSRIFTGFLLGVIPCLISGMILLAYATRSFVVGRLTEETRREIHRRIDSMISENSLALEGMDDAFNRIRFLNSFMNTAD